MTQAPTITWECPACGMPVRLTTATSVAVDPDEPDRLRVAVDELGVRRAVALHFESHDRE